jgi:hypothetical protein
MRLLVGFASGSVPSKTPYPLAGSKALESLLLSNLSHCVRGRGSGNHAEFFPELVALASLKNLPWNKGASDGYFPGLVALASLKRT